MGTILSLPDIPIMHTLLSAAEQPSRYTSLCRRIAATFRTDRDRRRALIDSLAQAASAA